MYYVMYIKKILCTNFLLTGTVLVAQDYLQPVLKCNLILNTMKGLVWGRVRRCLVYCSFQTQYVTAADGLHHCFASVAVM